MTVAMHTAAAIQEHCSRGGYQTSHRGDVLDQSDAYFMEYDTSRAGASSRCGCCRRERRSCWPRHTKLGRWRQGTLKRRIDEAAKFVPLENCAVPQCGFATTTATRCRSTSNAKAQRVVEVARSVWDKVWDDRAGKPRLVLDTNVWLDWLVFADPCVAPIKAGRRNKRKSSSTWPARRSSSAPRLRLAEVHLHATRRPLLASAGAWREG